MDIRPSIFVELGIRNGESYFGFCQAIAENAIECRAYAISNPWKGNLELSAELSFEDLRRYNDANYPGFSYLLERPFDEALSQFEDESIDILRLGGVRTFDEATRHFNAWLPKVKPGGIILLPGIMARHDDFGIWKLWNSLSSQGTTFEFHHGLGLGVFAKPSPQVKSDFLNTLFSRDPGLGTHLRRYYSLCAMELAWMRHLEYCKVLQNTGECRPKVSFEVQSDTKQLSTDQANLVALMPDIQQPMESFEKERDALLDECNAQQTRIYLLTESHRALKELQKKYAQLERTSEALQEDYQNLEQSFQRLINQYQGLERTLHGIINSHSWRITSPLRSLLQRLPRRAH